MIKRDGFQLIPSGLPAIPERRCWPGLGRAIVGLSRCDPNNRTAERRSWGAMGASRVAVAVVAVPAGC